MRECMARANEFRNHEELMEAAMTRPQDQEWYTKVLDRPGEDSGWDPNVHSEWNPNAVYRAWYTTYPSSNRSHLNKNNDKHVMLVTCSEPTDFFMNLFELRHIIGYRCSNGARVKDICSRVGLDVSCFVHLSTVC